MSQRPDEKLRSTESRHLARWWNTVLADVRRRWSSMQREPDAGYTTETVVVTGLLVIAALIVVAIIIAKVTEAANGISLVGG